MAESKIIDVLSDSEDSDASDASSDNSLVYSKRQIEEIGKLPLALNPPENFETIVERLRDGNVSATIFPSVPKAETELEEMNDVDIPDDVIEYLKHLDVGTEDLITKFKSFVEITKDQLDAMNEVSSALERVLKVEFPQCKAFPYGSSACGLGFQDCDLDIYVELGHNAVDEEFDERSSKWGVRFRTRKVCDLLKRAERFKSAVAVANARTPIVQLRERLTRIKCDINVGSSMGVRNTEFLAFCSVLDERFRTLVIILKYFCREQGITGSGKGNHLNNYTLALMVLFFLQRRGILHTVEVLQRGIEKEEIKGWNFAFCRDKSKLPELKPNPSSSTNLLSQFFEFYINFDFEYVICPLIGQKMKKKHIAMGIFLPKVLEGAPSFGRKGEKLELNKPIVVQDPFELTRNVAKAVSQQRREHMVEQFQTASRLMKYLKQEKSEAKLWMLFERNMVSFKNLHTKTFQGFSSVDGGMRSGVDVLAEDDSLQDLTDDQKLKHKLEREVEAEKMNEVKLCEEKQEVSIEPKECSAPSKGNLHDLGKGNSLPSLLEIKQFLFHHQRLRFPAPKL